MVVRRQGPFMLSGPIGARDGPRNREGTGRTRPIVSGNQEFSRTMNDTSANCLFDLLETTAQNFPEKISFRRRQPAGTFTGRTFLELKTLTERVVAGLLKIGVAPGDRVTFLCDASQNWLITDLGIITAGAVSVPRGTDVTDEDIIYIVTHSESKFAIVQRDRDRARLERLSPKIPTLKKIFFIEADDGDLTAGPGTLQEIIDLGQAALAAEPDLVKRRLAANDPRALATLIYTSGTTGAPKGVMLSQFGWLHAVRETSNRIGMGPEDRCVSLLPPWHAFERALEYAIVYRGLDFLISDAGNIKNDLNKFKPTVFPSVPRIWESVYNGILGNLKKESAAKQKLFAFFLAVGSAWARHRSVVLGYDHQVTRPAAIVSLVRRLLSLIALGALLPLKFLAGKIFGRIHAALGGQLRTSVTGGSALPGVVDRFLSAIGITVVEGYGMTETSAVISVRDPKRPTPGTVGTPIGGYQVRLKDETGRVLTSPGAKGTLWVRSDQLLQGYYKRPELNEVVFDADRFFDTGDIMRINWRGELMFAGRAKDTIALAGGENVEPVPIEDQLLTSDFIDQVMVVGDDKKTLGALIVPNFEAVKLALPDAPENRAVWDAHKDVRALFKKEITRLINQGTGFKNFETIPGNCFYVLAKNFDPDTEMTRTLKMKRPTIKEHFAEQIEGMYRG